MGKIGNWLITIVLGLFLLGLLALLIIPVYFSGKVAVVLSESMKPTMPMGSMAVALPIEPEAIRVDDIITFVPPWDPDVTVSHRVIEILENGTIAFRTKGDANADPDPWIIEGEHVTGRIEYHIPYVGRLANTTLHYSRTIIGFSLLVVLPSVMLIGSTIRDATKTTSLRDKRRRARLKRMKRLKKRW